MGKKWGRKKWGQKKWGQPDRRNGDSLRACRSETLRQAGQMGYDGFARQVSAAFGRSKWDYCPKPWQVSLSGGHEGSAIAEQFQQVVSGTDEFPLALDTSQTPEPEP